MSKKVLSTRKLNTSIPQEILDFNNITQESIQIISINDLPIFLQKKCKVQIH